MWAATAKVGCAAKIECTTGKWKYIYICNYCFGYVFSLHSLHEFIKHIFEGGISTATGATNTVHGNKVLLARLVRPTRHASQETVYALPDQVYRESFLELPGPYYGRHRSISELSESNEKGYGVHAM